MKPFLWTHTLGRHWRRVAAAVLLGLGSTVALAGYTLSFDPVAQSVPLGSQIEVTVRVGNFLPGGLGSYDFDLSFHASILAFSSARNLFGLGVAFGLGSAETSAGVLKVSDFSFEAELSLLEQQGRFTDFALFTIVFDTLAAGTSGLSFGNVTLGDAAQSRVDADVFAGSVTVEPRNVPEPATLWLVVAALAAGCGLRRGAARQPRSILPAQHA